MGTIELVFAIRAVKTFSSTAKVNDRCMLRSRDTIMPSRRLEEQERVNLIRQVINSAAILYPLAQSRHLSNIRNHSLLDDGIHENIGGICRMRQSLIDGIAL